MGEERAREVIQADRELRLTLLSLAEINRGRREHGIPIIDGLELLARHREAFADEARPFRSRRCALQSHIAGEKL